MQIIFYRSDEFNSDNDDDKFSISNASDSETDVEENLASEISMEVPKSEMSIEELRSEMSIDESLIEDFGIEPRLSEAGPPEFLEARETELLVTEASSSNQTNEVTPKNVTISELPKNVLPSNSDILGYYRYK